MELKRINKTAATEVNTGNGLITLYSYSTPVAVYHSATYTHFKTSKRWSVTTSKHINKWLDGKRAIEISQDDLERMIKEGISSLPKEIQAVVYQ